MRRFARMITVLVALAIAAGSVTNAAQASSMAIDMATAAHSDGAMMGCDACPGGDDTGMACASGCMTLLAALIPAAPSIAVPPAQALASAGAQHLAGYSRPPDPYPPRTTVLG